MEREAAAQYIRDGKAILGIEFGSTRIKGILIGEDHTPIAQGAHDWENHLENNIWTYHEDEIWTGLRSCYASLSEDVMHNYGVELTKLAAIGFSGMMHGYIACDRDGNMLVPFRTWRNTITAQASEQLTEYFQFHIPQRWSIAHLYQAILNNEEHVGRIDYLTTLAGYVHWKLTGRKVLGVGEASGMFPIDSEHPDASGKCGYRQDLLERFDILTAGKCAKGLADILPEVLNAGENAGYLSEAGARLIDPTGRLQAGTPMCPPEGDAGTGMTATNSVTVRTGNVSAGTSVFAMVVLEKNLKRVHDEIDIVTTPCGAGVAMVHCNNCTSDLNAWVKLFAEFSELIGKPMDMGELFGLLYKKAMEADPVCSGILGYNYFSGEHITGMEEGRPLLVRKPESRLSVANLMRSHIYTALGALKVGMDILLEDEKVAIDKMFGHGGFFKTEGVGQPIMSAALKAPVTVMETAGEGGAWGMALLAAYMVRKNAGETLPDYLANKVFAGQEGLTVMADALLQADFDAFMEGYRAGLSVERAAVDALH